MTMVWVASSFCYYLIAFQLKFIQGDIWINSITSSTSELFAFGLSGVIVGRLGLKWTVVISFFIANVGMILLAITQTQNQTLLAILIIGSKFGISANFNMAYVGNQILFPISVVASSYGVCNFFSRCATILSP